MKFLVLSDLHGKRSAIDWINRRIKENGVDCVLFLGDITDFGPEDVAVDILEDIDSDVYAIPGNCDPVSLPGIVAEHGTDMHGKFVNMAGLYIAGLGGSNPTIFNTLFELEEDEIYKKLKPISKRGMLLMTHAPAYGFNDMIPSGLNVGSHSILNIVKKYRPVAVLSGHVHEAFGTVVYDGTTFINPGAAKDGRCAVVTIEDGRVDARLFGPMD